MLPEYLSFPWPDDETIITHGKLKLGLTFRDPVAYLKDMRDREQAGFGYYPPTETEIEEAEKWDRYYILKFQQGELTGSVLDDDILAERAAREKERQEQERQERDRETKRQEENRATADEFALTWVGRHPNWWTVALGILAGAFLTASVIATWLVK